MRDRLRETFALTLAAVMSAMLLGACARSVSTADDFLLVSADVRKNAALASKRLKEIRDLVQAYNQTVPPALGLTLSFEAGALDTESRALLEDRIDSAEDESLRSLLIRMTECDMDLVDARTSIDAALARLPEPHRVHRGENHYTICLRYLQEHGSMRRGEAEALLAKAGLTRDLLEGNEVWMIYDGTRFCTFVTQGVASVPIQESPRMETRQPGGATRLAGIGGGAGLVEDSMHAVGAFIGAVKR